VAVVDFGELDGEVADVGDVDGGATEVGIEVGDVDVGDVDVADVDVGDVGVVDVDVVGVVDVDVVGVVDVGVADVELACASAAGVAESCGLVDPSGKTTDDSGVAPGELSPDVLGASSAGTSRILN
jgi:hypothetical protein